MRDGVTEGPIASVVEPVERDVLEVESQERRNRAYVPAWYYLHGHDLVHMRARQETVWFWIRKGGR